MAIVPGSTPADTIDTELNISRDYTAGGHAYWSAGVVLPIAKGGTGGATAAAARTALNVSESAGPNAATGGKAPVYNEFGRLVAEAAANAAEVVTKSQLDAALVLIAQHLDLIGALTARVVALEKKPKP
jgi:hypothetical protein